MKHLKKIFESNFTVYNRDLLSAVDILIELGESLTNLGLYKETYIPRQRNPSKNDCEFTTYVSSRDNRMSIFDMRKYVLNNIDKELASFEFRLDVVGENIENFKLDEILNEFKSKLEDMSPNSRIDLIKKKVVNDSVIEYSKGSHIERVKNEANLSIKISDFKKTRYV